MLTSAKSTAPLAEPAGEEPASATLVSTASASCAACGEALAGPYCHACGERAVRPEDESLAAFLGEQFQEVTSADGRLWRSVRDLFAPGKLTEEHFAGRRGLYVRPVRLFLVANVVFFLLLTWTGSNSSLQGRADSHRTAGVYGNWANRQLGRAAQEAGVSQDAYDVAFDQRSEALATTLVGVMVPAFALVLALALFWTGASVVRHVVFATHFATFAMAGSVLLALAFIGLQMMSRWLGIRDWVGYSIGSVFTVVMWIYFLIAIRRVYALRWWQALAVSAPVMGAGVTLTVLLYRWVLFVVTLQTLDVPA